MTIAERAKERCPHKFYLLSRENWEGGYIQGATEQNKIDIEKAWECINLIIESAMGGHITITKDSVIKAMEE